MKLRFDFLTLFLITLTALTACGGEPEPVKMDRTFLSDAELADQLLQVKGAIVGEVLDEYVWVSGADKVYTLLTQEHDAAAQYSGIFLRQYVVGTRQAPHLLWTYQDSIRCAVVGGTAAPSSAGADAGANLVLNTSPALRPASIVGDQGEQFVLRYALTCSTAADAPDQSTLVVINARTGTPELRLEAGLALEQTLGALDERTATFLRELWERG